MLIPESVQQKIAPAHDPNHSDSFVSLLPVLAVCSLMSGNAPNVVFMASILLLVSTQEGKGHGIYHGVLAVWIPMER
jgi:hypothetical protein